MKIPLRFENDIITFEIPSKNVEEVVRPKHVGSQGSNTSILSKAIENRSKQFGDLVKEKATVGVLLPDGTRDLPVKDILSLLLPLVKGVKQLLFFICTGSHSPNTEANSAIVETVKAETALAGIRSYQIITHDCQTEALCKAGMTSYGTDVWYNSHLDEVDLFCILSDVKHHYFAGYSNPVKNIIPGLCGFKTIERNHSFTFDGRSRAGIHPWHPDPVRRDNPLAADLLEAMGLIVRQRPVWSLVTINSTGAIQWAGFGPAKEITPHAFQQTDEWNMRTVEKVDFMIVSPGGLPNDVDLYIAQRALELTHSVVNDGGQILFLAACPKGIGSELTTEHFEHKLIKPLPDILHRRRGEYHLFEHKPFRFAQLIQRLDRLWLHTLIPSNTVKKMHMLPTNDPQDIAADWIRKKPDAKVLLVDGANKLLLMPRGG